jgi:O-antigen/teichoic acid export membrane protein
MFSANIFIARYLTQDLFGQYTMLRNAINTISNIINLSIGPNVIKEIAMRKSGKPSDLMNFVSSLYILITAIFLIIGLIVLASNKYILYYFFLDNRALSKALNLSLLIFLGSVFSYITQCILIGLEEFIRLANRSLIASTASIPIILILLYQFDLLGAILGISLYFILDFIVKFSWLKKSEIRFNFFKLKGSVVWNNFRELGSVSFIIMLSLIITMLSFWFSRIIILKATSTFSQIAIFDAAYQWLTIIMVITGSTSSVALTSFSKNFEFKDSDNQFRLLRINILINILLSVMIAMVFIAFSKTILSFYGEEYIKGYKVLVILSITSILFTISSVLNKYLLSRNKVIYILLTTLFSSFSLFIIVINTKNILGLAWSFFAFYLTSVLTYVLIIIPKSNLFKAINIKSIS